MNFSVNDGTVESAFGPYIPAMMDCISCGVCNASCPTYKVKPEEQFGPRGRIRMIERVLRKQDSLNQQELEAFHACTLCRACETVCPSRMAYGELYLQALHAMDRGVHRNRAVKLMLKLTNAGRVTQRLFNLLIRIYQGSGLQRVLRWLPFSPFPADIKVLESLLPVPHVATAIADYSPPKTAVCQGEVGLFIGCIAKIFDLQTHQATISLLTRLGYGVHVIADQTCCGATHAHNGDLESARRCARKNLDAFGKHRFDAVIYNSSGCGAFFSEYPKLLDADPSAEQSPTMILATDILDFLVALEWPGEVEFRALNTKVAVHEPCSQRNQTKNAESIYGLLEKIPELEILPLPENGICCGAGGTKMLTHPELAVPLRDEKVAALLRADADILISSNLSCALHLASGIRQQGRDIEVMHPLRLLAQQLI
ncbi:MAG: (Fe-S)-binding protein [Candidatus Thiodiazotropha sp.]